MSGFCVMHVKEDEISMASFILDNLEAKKSYSEMVKNFYGLCAEDMLLCLDSGHESSFKKNGMTKYFSLCNQKKSTSKDYDSYKKELYDAIDGMSDIEKVDFCDGYICTEIEYDRYKKRFEDGLIFTFDVLTQYEKMKLAIELIENRKY